MMPPRSVVVFISCGDSQWRLRLQKLGGSTDPAVDFELHPIRDKKPYSLPLATLVPLILILMTITGAVYPAIDLTAGERERGTLESLVATPMVVEPRSSPISRRSDGMVLRASVSVRSGWAMSAPAA